MGMMEVDPESPLGYEVRKHAMLIELFETMRERELKKLRVIRASLDFLGYSTVFFWLVCCLTNGLLSSWTTGVLVVICAAAIGYVTEVLLISAFKDFVAKSNEKLQAIADQVHTAEVRVQKEFLKNI